MSTAHAFYFEADERVLLGRAHTRRLRKQNKIPAIVYGGGQAPECISLSLYHVMRNLHDSAVYSHILTLNVQGKTQKVILKAIERHHIRTDVTHMDFQRICEDQTITMHVPFQFLGEHVCPGVKEEGGFVEHGMREILITCLPNHLPEYITVDVSHMRLGDSIHLSQLSLPHGVQVGEEFTQDPLVVQIQKTRTDDASPASDESKNN